MNRRVTSLVALMLSAAPLVVAAQGIKPGPGRYFVATNGSDAWNGKLPAPTAAKTDGPFATLARARDAVRGQAGEKTIVVRGGVYYLAEPLVLTPADSGVAFVAYPGEQPVLSGGRPVTGWRPGEGSLFTTTVPEVKAGKWTSQQLFVDGERQTRARYPNYDPAHPTTGGFLFVRAPANWPGGFGACVGSIHNPGDCLEYEITVPAAGDYAYWLYYGADNKPFGNDRMDDRTQVTVDAGPPALLKNLPDTGGWTTFAWAQCALLPLTAGKHTLRWTNVKGGGLNLDAFALCDDLAWKPQGTQLAPPAGDRHLLVIQCECFARAHGEQMTVDAFNDPTGMLLYFGRGALHAWPRSPEKALHLFVYEGGLCSNAIVPIASIDEGQSLLTTARRIADYQAEVGARFFVDNVREALDSPGEWYLDRATGELTYWPTRKDLARTRTVVSVLDRLVELNGDAAAGRPVERVRCEGLTFECTDYGLQRSDWYQSDCAAVWLRCAHGCRFAGNRFLNLGGAAIVMVGNCTGNEVLGNEIAYGGAGGVSINGNPDNIHLAPAAEGKPAEGNRILGNHIHHTGLLFKHGNPICLNSAERNVIAYNEVHDVPRMGILVTADGGGNVIEYNDLRRTSLDTGDTGAIYTYAVIKPQVGNTIRNNVVIDTIGMGTTREGRIVSPNYSWGIYLDGESSNSTVQDNLVVGNVLGGVFINGGHNNTVTNNILVNGAQTQVMYSDYALRGLGNVFRRNLVAWTDPKATLGLPGSGAKDAAHLDSDENLYWHGGLPVSEFAELQQRGLDTHSVVADPLFANPAAGDYGLRPGSPALKLGFRPLDLTRVGRKGYAESPRPGG